MDSEKKQFYYLLLSLCYETCNTNMNSKSNNSCLIFKIFGFTKFFKIPMVVSLISNQYIVHRSSYGETIDNNRYFGNT